MPEIIVGEEHSQVYDVWRERGSRDLSLTHVDFHCDMRGLLLDRRRGRAWFIDASDRRVSHADSGNFMAHAIMEGIVSSIRWVHDSYGGRRWDTGTVKFETDLTALPHLLLHRLRPRREVSVSFSELTFEAWDGVREGEQLDIDWDGIASIDYSDAQIRGLMDSFIKRDYPVIPQTTFLVYSPGYSHPNRGLFEEFLERLAARFGAEIERLPSPPAVEPPSGVQRVLETVERKLVLGLRAVGIY